jgi:hypothetical protein
MDGWRRGTCIVATVEVRIMKRHLSFGVVAFAAAVTSVAASGQQKIPSEVPKQPVTLTGCVAAGEKHDTYVLTNVTSSAGATVGTSGSTAMPVYWLDEPDKLKKHVGHKVEIVGTLTGDVDKTKIKAKDGELEMKADGKEVKVPEGSSAAAHLPATGEKGPGYKVKVKSVKSIASSCQ